MDFGGLRRFERDKGTLMLFGGRGVRGFKGIRGLEFSYLGLQASLLGCSIVMIAGLFPRIM